MPEAERIAPFDVYTRRGGISLWPAGARGWRLVVVDHRARETLQCYLSAEDALAVVGTIRRGGLAPWE